MNYGQVNTHLHVVNRCNNLANTHNIHVVYRCIKLTHISCSINTVIHPLIRTAKIN